MASILQRPALVLNRNWQPVHISTVQRALVLLARDAARVVDPRTFQLFTWDEWVGQAPVDGEPAVRGVTVCLRAPEVVALVRYDRTPDGYVTFSKRNVFKRDRLTCQYCGRQPGRDELTLDHVQPKSRGGPSSWENCVVACIECNRRKADLTLEQTGMRLRRHPARPTWKPYYAHSGKLASWAPFLGEPKDALALVS